MVPKLRRGQLYEAASENPTWGEVILTWLENGAGRGVCLQGSKARREPGADLAHEMKADTAAGTEVCLKQIHSQNKFLWQFLKADQKPMHLWEILMSDSNCISRGRGFEC